MEKICKDIQIGYTTIKDFNIVGIDSYEEDSKGLTVNYKDGSSVKINGSTSAIKGDLRNFYSESGVWFTEFCRRYDGL